MRMPHDDTFARLSAALVTRAGGYLHNPVREDGQTCAVCAKPVSGFQRCYGCDQHSQLGQLADASAFLTYAVAGQQSGYVMRGYKAPQPLPEHRTIVALLVYLGLAGHAKCPGALAGFPVTRWATVPSLPSKPGEHPFRKFVAGLAPGQEIQLTAAADAWYPRGVSHDHFAAAEALPEGSHVLLLDDTWASGGHAQSAALALRRAGAARISLLVVARWLNKNYGDNAGFLRQLARRDYDPGICPWTGGGCP